ncbi:hypothetical protein NUU61_006224 [Penicillium alfredii]|uniref:Zn(2)-C6 fungal-type domain-containing protein n=1 Tax=Penicillium alfredii TaxID=1506179 RepID=A0A9W9F0F7_9EURO|nr:uncharacterized protein NUU61_006224 [Penicillium alfredii]KAJ5091354.1 hypothetical protein NUU61_006224 [Penicillium alfredii]
MNGQRVAPRGRIGAPKSRAGCRICKIRKVKCGEERPNCLRCTSTGRKCEYEGGKSPTALVPPSTLTPGQTLSSAPDTGRRERRAFEYYFQHAAQYLAGGLGIDFWTNVVPQICRSEPPVWDAMIAISALFEYPDQCMDFTFLRRHNGHPIAHPNQKDALIWYSRSMSSVHSQIEHGKADPYTALISCVLFICIETIQGHVEEALQLYGQGVSLILDLRAKVHNGVLPITLTKAALLEHTIIPLFLRLGTIALSISGIPLSELFQLVPNDPEPTFTSIESVRFAIMTLSTEVMLFQREAMLHLKTVGSDSAVSPEMVMRQQNLQARLAHWLHAYKQLSNTEPVLLTHHAAASIWVSTCLTQHETSSDAHLTDFQVIVDQSTLCLNASAGVNGNQPPFTFEMGVGISLYLTAMKCREPRLRRRALELLRQAPPMQGFYKCTPAAALAEAIMQLEEGFSLALRGSSQDVDGITSAEVPGPVHESMSAFIPEEARVHFIGVFRPQDGLPPGVLEDDLAKWNRGPDQLFLEFARQQHDLSSNSWRLVSQCVPVGI